MVAAVSSDMIPVSHDNTGDYYTWPEVDPRHKSVAGAVQRLDLVMRCNIPVRSCVQDLGEIVELESSKQSYATVLGHPYLSQYLAYNHRWLVL